MGYNILIVDDSLAMRKVIVKTLKMSGLQGQFFEAANGYIALETVQKSWVDLVLTDIHMPDMDGIEFVGKLKEIPTCAEIPVIVISTEGREKVMEKVKNMGVSGYLTKPFKPGEVRDLILAVLEVDPYESEADDDDCDF
jgi:two-component system chemotaxis response regulator CheY